MLKRTGHNQSNSEYDDFRGYLERHCGIVLGDNKQYLVSSRLGGLMREHDMASLGELVERLNQGGRALRQAVIDAMTTNETLWFRDQYPFNILTAKILPEFASSSTLSIWSAACSTGQEPYSIAMTLEEAKRVGGKNTDYRITGTDINASVLAKAGEGIYDSLALARGLSIERKERYFQPLEEGRWQIKSAMRQKVSFRALNLLDSYGALGKFDIIFCRNVLIYFSQERKADILNRMAGALRPNGYLFLGASESVTSLTSAFEMIHCRPGIVYRKKA